jgi:hypothetical protein
MWQKIMLFRTLYIFSFISVIYGCGKNEAPPSNLPAAPKVVVAERSPMSKAFDPLKSTKVDLDVWLDKGGLNYNNDFFGVPIINASFGTFDDNKKLGRAELIVSPEVSTEKMRIAVATACGTTEDKMVRKDLPNARAAEYKTRQDERRSLVCYYEATGSKNYILLLASSEEK